VLPSRPGRRVGHCAVALVAEQKRDEGGDLRPGLLCAWSGRCFAEVVVRSGTSIPRYSGVSTFPVSASFTRAPSAAHIQGDRPGQFR